MAKDHDFYQFCQLIGLKTTLLICQFRLVKNSQHSELMYGTDIFRRVILVLAEQKPEINFLGTY